MTDDRKWIDPGARVRRRNTPQSRVHDERKTRDRDENPSDTRSHKSLAPAGPQRSMDIAAATTDNSRKSGAALVFWQPIRFL